MEKYIEMKRRHEKEVTEFPFGFAFNDEQLMEVCEKLGVKSATRELLAIGMGTFIRKKDKESYDNMISRIGRELREGFEDFDFLVEAFKYELGNHEYCVTCEAEDTIYSLGLLPSEVKKSEHMYGALREAIRLYWKDVENIL